MGMIEDIAQLMLREGEIKAQEGRERIAAEEEQRQGRHRLRNNTLKALALGAITYFTAGAGTPAAASALYGRKKKNGALTYDEMLEAAAQGGGGIAFPTASRRYDPLRDGRAVVPWDEEGVG